MAATRRYCQIDVPGAGGKRHCSWEGRSLERIREAIAQARYEWPQ
jgi:hypothetical protein